MFRKLMSVVTCRSPNLSGRKRIACRSKFYLRKSMNIIATRMLLLPVIIGLCGCATREHHFKYEPGISIIPPIEMKTKITVNVEKIEGFRVLPELGEEIKEAITKDLFRNVFPIIRYTDPDLYVDVDVGFIKYSEGSYLGCGCLSVPLLPLVLLGIPLNKAIGTTGIELTISIYPDKFNPMAKYRAVKRIEKSYGLYHGLNYLIGMKKSVVRLALREAMDDIKSQIRNDRYQIMQEATPGVTAKLPKKEIQPVSKKDALTRLMHSKDTNPPIIFISSPEDSSVTEDREVTVSGAVYDETQLARIEINGKQISGMRGVSVVPKGLALPYPAKDTLLFSETVSLVRGINEIRVEAFDAQGQQAIRKIKVICNVGQPQGSSLPSMYAVIVGISDYRDPRIQDLKYADADAQSFFKFLMSQKELGAFKTIHTTYLLNQEATLKSIKSGLADLINAREDDICIIYFAGHGLIDKLGDPYLITYDTNIEDLYATAFPMSELNRLMKERIFSDKVLMLADACHSGSITTGIRGRGEIYSKFSKLLEATRGKAILTASRPQEFSREEEGHGVFTYYLIQGLQGDADTDTDGIVTLNEIYDYVYDKVKDKTKGAQHPYLGGNPAGEMPLSVVK